MAGTASNYCNLQDYPINHIRLWEYLRSNAKCCFPLGTAHARKLIENITGTNFKMFLNARGVLVPSKSKPHTSKPALITFLVFFCLPPLFLNL